ncbi:MAG TPA: ECF-type sigma factor [Planctomycetaceae bacterium]|jgi:RNA polymerase sigma factor (TIGR02999 family)|nr:ECF-type sigma factor [Planctomycetaceae bacterium]
MSDVTRILSAIDQGDPVAAEKLLPLVYDELRKLAIHKMAQEKSGQTLQPTALVHEAWLRLVGVESPQKWDGRGHFFAAAAEAMRRILVEQARRKKRIKHGGEWRRADAGELNLVAADEMNLVSAAEDEVISVHEAVDGLAAVDAQAAQVVKLHFFAGLTLEDVASLLEISSRTAYRDWAFARAWLAKRLDGPENEIS